MYSSSFPVRVLVAGAVLALGSCSVKEDRALCPCFLTLDLSGVEQLHLRKEGLDALGVYVTDCNGFVAEDNIALEDCVQEYVVAVPRGVIDLCVGASGYGGVFSAADGLSIPEGEQCPVVYMYADKIAAEGNSIRKAAILHKNWCRIDLNMKNTVSGYTRPFHVSVVGNICGYSTDGTPKEGPFSCESERSRAGVCQVRVPRQIDDSLWLRVHFEDADEIRGFPLGAFMSSSGYDWTAADLEDIQVSMDFARSAVTLTISSWQRTLSFEMLI